MGDVLGGYVIAALAGAGGMGVVYRARDEALDRTVAVKVIAPEYARDPRFREMFLRESRAAAAIEHPGVVPVYRADEDGDRLYIAMRFVDGESLAELISRRGRVPPAQAARLLTQVASALEAAHAKGLLHRDVKPANILISGEGDDELAYLSDFGLATRFVSDAAGGHWAGTLAYLGPEQIRGGTLDARTDVYALGCVLFHGLTGRVPFPTRNEQAVLVAHLTEAPPSVSEIAPGVPSGFDAVVARAMAKRPEDRYPSARAFAEALGALRFDAIVVHHPDDAGAAGDVRALLKADGLEVWEPAPGADDPLEALRTAGACIVLVGANGLGDWAREPLALAQDLAARDRSFRLAAALLPGAPDPFGPGMAFLAGRAWADLRPGVDDPDARRELLRLVREDPPPPARDAGPEVNPYRGLAAFGEDDAEFFAGREDETAQLVERLRERRFLAVLGPSGSGKSSLVSAGLIPAVRRGALGAKWRIATLTPGQRPLAALAAALERLVPPSSNRPGPGEIGTDPAALQRALDGALGGPDSDECALLVVDQLEEAFTLADPDERTAFLDALTRAATLPGSRIWVVVAMRADFYPRCAEHAALRDLVAANQFLVGAMGPAALRRAIEVPARRAGLTLEAGLTRRILGDVAGRPGALPLLQYLLLELWNRRRGRELTLEAYAASGGVESALARRAEEVFAALSPERQAVARRIMLRLTQPGEGTEDTRRRAQRRELALGPEDEADVDAVVAAFTEARLLTTAQDPASGEPTVEVAHEALIRGWPRLREWLDEEREGLRLQHRLTEVADDWERSGREDGLLYRGARLAEWRERDRSRLNPRESEFLDASATQADRERAAGRRRVRIALGALVAGLVVVAAAGIFALVQRNDARDERDTARSRQLAVESQIQLPTDPELAVLLAQEGYEAQPTTEAEQALRQAVHDSRVRGTLRMQDEIPLAVASSADGLAAVGTDGGILRLWDTEQDPRGASAQTLGTWDGGINTVARAGDAYLTGGNDGAVVRWPATSSGPESQVLARMDGGVYSVRIAPDGRRALAAGDGGVVTIDLTTGRARSVVPPGAFFEVAFDALPGAVITTDAEGRLLRWRQGAVEPEPITIPGTAQIMGASPDGRLLGVGTGQGIVVLRLGATPEIVYSTEFESGTNSIAFGSEGRVAAAGGDGSVRVLDRSGRILARMTGHDGPVAGVAFISPDRIVSVGVDGTARAWAWSDGQEQRLQAPALALDGAVAFRPTGSIGLVGADGATQVWTPPRAAARSVLPPLAGASVASAATSSDARRVATGADDGSLVVRDASAERVASWSLDDIPNEVRLDSAGRRVAAALRGGDVVLADTAGGAEPRVLGRHAEDATAVAVSPADGQVASAGRDGTVRIWTGPPEGRLVADLDAQVNDLAFSDDGRWLAAAVGDETARVWDLSDRDSPRVLRGRLGDVESVAFSAEGAHLATGGEGGVRIWDWRRGVILLTEPTDSGTPGVAARGPEPQVASYGYDNLVRTVTCDVCGPIDEVMDLADQRTTRELTEQELTDFDPR